MSVISESPVEPAVTQTILQRLNRKKEPIRRIWTLSVCKITITTQLVFLI